MNKQHRDQPSKASTKERVARIIYPPFMALLILSMLVTIFISISIIYYISTETIEPRWLLAIEPVFQLISQVISSEESGASRVLDSLNIAVTALIMGVFLRRCSQGANSVELFSIVLFLVMGATQLILILVLPTSEEASLAISRGGRMVEHLNILLARNANIALAIFSAAIGIQLYKAEE